MDISNYKYISTLVGGNLILFISNALPITAFKKEKYNNILLSDTKNVLILDSLKKIENFVLALCFIIKIDGSPRMLSLTKKLLTG